MSNSGASPGATTTGGELPTSAGQWHKRIWQLTWPVILANITIPLVGVADVAVMGRIPDPAYIAAVAMGSAMFSAVYWLFGFLRMGTTGLAAQAFGRGNLPEIAKIFLRAGTVGIALGIAIVLLQWPLASLLFGIFDASPELTSLAGQYYDIRIFGAPALLLYLVELGILFGLQRTRDTLYLSVGLNVTNLILDVVLVMGFDMGVRGVAWGTLISEWSAAAGGLVLAVRGLGQQGWKLSWPGDVWRLQQMATLFHVSANLILRTFFVQLPFFAGTVIATRLGEATLAAHGVLMQLFFVMTYSLDGFAHTAETMAGYSYGAGRADQLRAATRYNAIWAMFLALFTGLIYWLGGEWFIGLLTTSATVRGIAGEFLPWVAMAPLVCVWAFLLDGIFIGTTHITQMRNAMIVAALVWAGALALTFQPLGYHGVWLSMMIFMLVRSGLLAWYYPRLVGNAAAQQAAQL